MHLVHTERAPQYLSDSVQTVARSSSRPGLRSSSTTVYTSRGAEQSSESTAPLMLDLLHGTVFHTISIISVTLNYFVEHTSLVVSAPGRSVNSAIEMTVLLLLLLMWWYHNVTAVGPERALR